MTKAKPPRGSSNCGECGRIDGCLIEHQGNRVCFECLVKIKRREQRLFIGGNELLTSEPRVNWIIKGLIESDSTGQLFGPSGGGKSFVALDLVLAVATGQAWNGKDTKQGAVLYLAGEGRTGMKRRIKAWYQQAGNPNLSLFNLSQHTVQFDETALGKIVRAGKEIESATGHDVAFIVVDTLNRHMPGDENSTREMSSFISVADEIRAEFPGSALMIVHHTGNSDEAKHRSRGSSALKAACDFEMHVDKGLLTFTKLKDGNLPEPMPFKLCPVQIGSDEDGEPVVSCVVEYGERSQRHREADLTPNERTLLGLCKAYPDILIGDLRNVFYNKRRELEPEAKYATLKKAFSRAWEGISAKGFVDLNNNSVTWGQGDKGGHLGDMYLEGDRGTLGDTPKGVVSPCPCTPCPPLPLSTHDPLDDLNEFIDQGGTP